ncbi:LOW QUALITY PROTEIN: hypothetical protein HID58_073846 [Brassica napus]|uniref:DUF4283 domain-containing protein n=1 Tax=Brassica napus TaxID=3708 RepID=A0ABQ7YF32_BRANA|nr:LOW QUALITY PROTEIN: hypothetical protein HID58_073846 [Brassica napus]
MIMKALITGDPSGDPSSDPSATSEDSIAVHLPGDFSGDPTTEGTGDSIASELGDRSDPTEGHGVASTDSGSPTTDNPLRSTTLSTPLPAEQSVGASETPHERGVSSLALFDGGATEGRDGGENLDKSLNGNHGGKPEGRNGGKQEERVRSGPWSTEMTGRGGAEPVIDIVDGIATLQIPDAVFDEAELLWKNFVVGYFIGDAPHVGSIHATVNRIWTGPKAGTKIDVQFIAKNTVLFRIENDQMRNRVIQRKYWHIADIPGKEVEGSKEIGVKDDKISGGEETGIVEAVETMAKEGNAMEHLIKDLEELSPVASSDQKEAIKISESSKELSKTMDVWVNGKGVKASSDGNGEKEFMISPSRFSPLQDIDEEETCLEGGGTEVEEGEFRENIVDGKKEMELQVASTSRQQGTVTRQLRGRVTGSKDRSNGGRHGTSKKTSIMTSFFAWNMRGFNLPRKHRALRSWLLEEKPTYGCLVETRVQESNHQWCMIVAMPGWNSLTNYAYHPLGRIWFCWTDEVVVTRLHTSSQVITCAIQNPSTGEQYICSAIYAFNTSEGTHQLSLRRRLQWVSVSVHYPSGT